MGITATDMVTTDISWQEFRVEQGLEAEQSDVFVTDLSRPWTEREAAAILGVSLNTLRRERRLGRIGHTAVGRRPRYMKSHIANYLKANETSPCQKLEGAQHPWLASGSASALTAHNGAGHGLTQKHDKRAEHRSALLMLRLPSKT